MAKRKKKRGAKSSATLWTVADNLWFALRVFVGTVLLIPTAIVLVVAYVVTPRPAWDWYKSWIVRGEAPPSTPKTKPKLEHVEEFPAPRYVPIETETEINEPQRDRGEAGERHSGDNAGV